MARELTKGLWVDKLTEKVEVQGTGRAVERKQGCVKPGEARAKNRKSKTNLKLSLRGSVEIQAIRGLHS